MSLGQRDVRPLITLRPSQMLKDGLARAILDLHSLNGGAHYRKFVIVGTARTGSTLLVNLLNAHSQALVFGELFRSQESIGWDVPPFVGYQNSRLLALYRSDPLRFIAKGVFRRWPRACVAVGFKLFYYHARSASQSVVWDYLRENTDISILHIKRKNILEQYLSLRLAHQTNVWSSAFPLSHQPEPIKLDVHACRQHFSWVRRLEQDCETHFKSHNFRTVYYETLAADQNREMESIQKFLGLKPEQLGASMARQRTRPVSEAISNYDELRAAFAQTEWSAFFNGCAG
jgi:LPS sulfotransferase NodH